MYAAIQESSTIPSEFWCVLEPTKEEFPMAATLSLLCLMCIAQPDRPTDAAKEELKKLQGTWIVELQVDDGEKLADGDLKGRTISFGMNHFLVRHNAAMKQIGKIKIDPGKQSINASIEKGDREGDLLPGIYELNGDTLKICLGTDDNRPKDLKAGANRLLIVCKRVAAKAGEADLSGKYKCDSVDIIGKRLRYDTTIERIGDSYLALYTVQGKLVYFGTGVRKGNVFAMGWMSQGRPGITVFQIEKGNRLVGEFTEIGGTGFFGTETLTPVPNEPLGPDARR
jgi:uncharacterized protein (TIGR03067 family)